MLRRLLPLFALLALNGCAYLASVSSDLDARLDSWVAQQEYGKALAALRHVKPTHANYAQLMKQRDAILLKSEQYERETVTQATELARRGQWAQALERYEQALSRLPEGKTLRAGQAQLLKQQAARLDDVELDLLIARGEGLLQLLPLYTKRANVDPRSWQAQRDLRTTQEEAERIGLELTRRGRNALEQRDLNQARRSLPLALRLYPSPETKQANQDLLRRLGPPAPAGKPTAKASRDDETADLLQRYRKAYSNKEWHEAQRLLALLELQSSPPEELPQLRSELNAEVTEAVNRHIERGIALYSDGKYEQALSVWQQAQQLDPGNERVRAHIERVERVLEKLRALQEKRGAE